MKKKECGLDHEKTKAILNWKYPLWHCAFHQNNCISNDALVISGDMIVYSMSLSILLARIVGVASCKGDWFYTHGGLAGRQIIEPWAKLVFWFSFWFISDPNAYMRFLLACPTIWGQQKSWQNCFIYIITMKWMNESLKCDRLMGCQCCEWIRWTHYMSLTCLSESSLYSLTLFLPQ